MTDVGGQKTVVRTDSVLLARDLDGGGKKDYVVRESKPAEWSALQLLFDAKQRRFTPVHALCVNRR